MYIDLERNAVLPMTGKYGFGKYETDTNSEYKKYRCRVKKVMRFVYVLQYVYDYEENGECGM